MGNQIGKRVFHPPEPVTYTSRRTPPKQLKWNRSAALARELEISWIKSSDGDGPCFIAVEHIQPVVNGRGPLWVQRGEVRRPLLIYCHANAEDLGMISPVLHHFSNIWEIEILAFDYMGYGLSSGGPCTEQGVYNSVMIVYTYIRDTLKVPVEQIYVLGKSVGSGAATYLASKVPQMGGLILQSGFTSIFGIVGLTLPGDWFPNSRMIRYVQAPTLIIHGTDDTLIPTSHASELHKKAPRAYNLALFAGAGHNDVEEMAGIVFTQTVQRFICYTYGLHFPQWCTQALYGGHLSTTKWLLKYFVSERGSKPRDLAWPRFSGLPRMMNSDNYPLFKSMTTASAFEVVGECDLLLRHLEKAKVGQRVLFDINELFRHLSCQYDYSFWQTLTYIDRESSICNIESGSVEELKKGGPIRKSYQRGAAMTRQYEPGHRRRRTRSCVVGETSTCHNKQQHSSNRPRQRKFRRTTIHEIQYNESRALTHSGRIQNGERTHAPRAVSVPLIPTAVGVSIDSETLLSNNQANVTSRTLSTVERSESSTSEEWDRGKREMEIS